MDGFTGFKTATSEELSDATAVMDPFHVVRLAGDALDKCRRRVQLSIHGHRGMKNDPLYAARRTLHTGADLLTDRQKNREPDRTKGRALMVKLIESVSAGVPKALTELVTLGRTLKQRPQPRQSTAGSRTYAAPPSGSAT
jgi:transposase